MRFLFLGTGTSAGVPIIGCSCETCVSADPRDTRLRTGAAIQWKDASGGDRVVLLDTTPDLRQQALRHALRRCDAIFYTHNHVDHVFGLDEVRRFNAVMKTPIDVYAERHTLDELRRIYKHIFEQDKNVNKSFVATLVPNLVEPGRRVDLHGLSFTPIRLLHGRLPIVGYRIDRTDPTSPTSPTEHGAQGTGHSLFPLAYCTDVSAIPTESWGAFRGVRTLVLSALRYRKHATHMTVDESLNVAAQIGARRTFFIHMTHDILHADLESRLPEGVQLAHDGLTLE